MFKILKELRNQKGYSTRDMADMLDISKAFYSQIENRKRRLSYDLAVKIADVFKEKPDYIFYDDFVNEKENS